jgi:ubiquitin carboxyl-terminal hydrolase 22/27/51
VSIAGQSPRYIMSNTSTQASSVESPPSTEATSVSISADNTSGCVHLAEYLRSGTDFGQDFVRSLSKIFSKFSKSDDPEKSALQYHCLRCDEAGDASSIEIHCNKSQHSFSLCAQSSAIYCSRCKDTIYTKATAQSRPYATSTNTAKKRSSSEANGEDSYITANTSQRPCGREGVRGLFNLGHTCYMNAVVQTMIHNSLLSSFFLGKGHQGHTCPKNNSFIDNDEEADAAAPCVACAFTEVFSESRFSTNTQPMAALSLLKASWLSIPEMQGERQQDSHEWYLHIIDKLHECEKPAYDHKGVCRCFIHKAFFGRTRQEISCEKCGFVSRTQEEMLYLSLDFQKQVNANKKKAAEAPHSGQPQANPPIPTLTSCLEDLTLPEKLTDDTYSCRGCEKKGKMTKTVRMRKLPVILCMQVNRFTNEVKGGSIVQRKIKGRVSYPESIDMRPYTTKASSPKKKKKQQKGKETNGDVDHEEAGEEDEKFVYDLESVIVHEGKAIEQGHYFAFCRGVDGGRRGEWYMFNDAKVTVASEGMVLEQEAYLLFYGLRRVCGKRGSGKDGGEG